MVTALPSACWADAELSAFKPGPHAARFLAKKFAAKEAFAKAVGSGLRDPVSLRRISITHDGLGKPVLQFDEVLRSHLAQLGIIGHHLSISDERNMIVAFVVLETDDWCPEITARRCYESGSGDAGCGWRTTDRRR